MRTNTALTQKRWWERPVGIVVLGIVVTVVGGLIVWLISRHYDSPPSSNVALESPSNVKAGWTIAGTVVDAKTNHGIGQAAITVVGRSEKDVTEDNGNFRITLQLPVPKNGIVRIHVVKIGYLPDDETTTPTDTLVIQLRKEV